MPETETQRRDRLYNGRNPQFMSPENVRDTRGSTPEDRAASAAFENMRIRDPQRYNELLDAENHRIEQLREQRQEGGGWFGDTFLNISRIRGQRYEKWLEQRLVLVHNDVDYVNEVRKKFGYDKTNIVGRGQLTTQGVKEEVCGREPEDQQFIDPSLRCKPQQGGYKKTRKYKRKGRKGKKQSRKQK
jgi:hypothetical protein